MNNSDISNLVERRDMVVAYLREKYPYTLDEYTKVKKKSAKRKTDSEKIIEAIENLSRATKEATINKFKNELLALQVGNQGTKKKLEVKKTEEQISRKPNKTVKATKEKKEQETTARITVIHKPATLSPTEFKLEEFKPNPIDLAIKKKEEFYQNLLTNIFVKAQAQKRKLLLKYTSQFRDEGRRNYSNPTIEILEGNIETSNLKQSQIKKLRKLEEQVNDNINTYVSRRKQAIVNEWNNSRYLKQYLDECKLVDQKIPELFKKINARKKNEINKLKTKRNQVREELSDDKLSELEARKLFFTKEYQAILEGEEHDSFTSIYQSARQRAKNKDVFDKTAKIFLREYTIKQNDDLRENSKQNATTIKTFNIISRSRQFENILISNWFRLIRNVSSEEMEEFGHGVSGELKYLKRSIEDDSTYKRVNGVYVLDSNLKTSNPLGRLIRLENRIGLVTPFVSISNEGNPSLILEYRN